MTDDTPRPLKHTHYSPYEPPRQVPGTLLDCTPEFPSYHHVEGSETAADYMYSPRFGPHSATGLPQFTVAVLSGAYLQHRDKDTQWRITDVTHDPEFTYRVRITNRTAHNGDGPDWHTEEWGIHSHGDWGPIVTNPHPGYEHAPSFCPNCGY
jgi:hypothetical protein